MRGPPVAIRAAGHPGSVERHNPPREELPVKAGCAPG